MSRYYSASSKRLNWRLTYGKRFVSAKAVKMAQAAAITASSHCHLSCIAAASGDPVKKALAIAEIISNTTKAVVDLDINRGFINKP